MRQDFPPIAAMSVAARQHASQRRKPVWVGPRQRKAARQRPRGFDSQANQRMTWCLTQFPGESAMRFFLGKPFTLFLELPWRHCRNSGRKTVSHFSWNCLGDVAAIPDGKPFHTFPGIALARGACLRRRALGQHLAHRRHRAAQLVDGVVDQRPLLLQAGKLLFRLVQRELELFGV